MVFHLKVKLGNAAMSTGADLADLLSRIVTTMTLGNYNEDDLRAMAEDGARDYVRDANGNRVGYWTVESEEG